MAIFSASGFLVHTPCGPRKSGMPESVEIPAPVSTTTRRARSTRDRARATSSSFTAAMVPYAASMPARDLPTVELLHAADAEDRQRRAAGSLLARGLTEGDRVAFALGSSADLICAVLGAARVGLIPVLLNATLTPAERDLLVEDAQPALRIFEPAALAVLADGSPAELAPVSAHPADALHVGHHGPAQGRDHRNLGRGHGTRRLRGRGVGLALRPRRPAHGVLADVPHRLDPLLGRARSSRAGRWPS